MEHKQTNHGKIKIVAGIFAIALVAVLLYWLFTSLLNTNQHSQTKQEPSRTANYQMDDKNTSPQQPSTNSKSNLDNNRTNQPNKDTESSSNSSTKTTVNNAAAIHRSSTASQYPKAILASKKPPTSDSIFQKPKRKPTTKPGGNKPTTPPNPSKPPKPTQAAVKIVGAAEVGSTLIAQIDDPDGLKDGGIRYYQWFADGAAIHGASYFSYKLTPSEVGKKITVKTTHANNKNVMKDLISSATAAVGNAASNNNHGSVTIDGINRVGQVFTARITDADGVPESGITYRWYEFYGKFLGTGKTLIQTRPRYASHRPSQLHRQKRT